jgi:hypothetical protein
MAAYVEVVTAAIHAAGGPVVLAVHSLGGIAASLAVESRAEAPRDRVRQLAVAQRRRDRPGSYGRGGFDCVLTRQGALVVSEDGATIRVDSSQTAVEAFYNCCDPGIAEGAAARLVPEPLAPVLQPLSVTAARFGSVPKTYVGPGATR